MSYLSEIAADVRRELPYGVAAPEDSESLFLLYAVLVRVRGSRTTAKDVHDAWAAWMSLKDPSHESLIPFEQLAPEVQAEDEPFVQAIWKVASRLDDRH